MTDLGSGSEYAEVLRHFNIYDARTSAVLDEALDYARYHCPVAHSDANGGYYLVSRYADVASVLGEPGQFSSQCSKSLPPRQQLEMPPLDSDPPEHREYRRLLNPFFSRGALAKHEPAIRQIARDLIDRFVSRGEFEMVDDYATPLTAATLCRVIFNLEDEELANRARDTVDAISISNSIEAWSDLKELLGEFMHTRPPNGQESVLDAISTASINGVQLTDEQKLGVISVLFLGGLDTTRAQITSIARHLALKPGLESRLRDPNWTRSDLDEFLRYDSVVTAEARQVTGDTELNGADLHDGDYLLLHYYSANHDIDKFESPDELKFERSRNPHMAFGLGIHRCLGSNLARLQIAVAFDELLSSVQNLRIADEAEIVLSPGVTRMPASLPLVFDRL
jgi:cytochrome P450